MSKAIKAEQVLTRMDRTTGQKAYDYKLRRVVSETGRYLGQDGVRYALVEVVVRRYVIE